MNVNIYQIRGIDSKKVQTITMNKELELYKSNELALSEELINDFGNTNNFKKLLIKIKKGIEKEEFQNVAYLLYRKYTKENKIFAYSVYGNDEMELNKLISIGVKKIENFQEDFKEKCKIEEYIFFIDCIIFVSEILNIELKNKDLQYLKEIINEKKYCDKDDEEEKVSYIRGLISDIIMTYSPKWNELSKDREHYCSSATELQDCVEEKTQREYTESISTYYKTVLKEEAIEEFENMTELIKNELINYDVNFIYCEKIINFITEEFSEQGVFPMDLFFIKQFAYNATLQMILTITKLYYDKPSMENKKNFGFNYLKAFICNNTIDNNQLDVKQVLSSIKGLERESKKVSKCMEDIRNSLIAHYDIDMEKVEEIKK